MKLNKLLAVIAIFVNLCAVNATQAQTIPNNQHCDTLYAGQDSNAGRVCVTIDTDVGNVTIDYRLSPDWTLSEAHAWVGDNMALMPQNRKGNPQVGRFPHSASGLGGFSTYRFVIPLSDLPINPDTFCEAQVFVAAHAVVSKAGSKGKSNTQTESAWAGSTQIASGGSWARYFSFTNDFCDDTDPEYPMVVLPESCFNVFGQGISSATEPVIAAAFTPVGVTGTTSAWLNTYRSSPAGFFGGDLVSGNGTIVGTFLAGPGGSTDFAVELALDSAASPSLTLLSLNVFFDTAGGYQDMSPLDYGLSFLGNGSGSLAVSVPLQFAPEQMDTIVHAVICTGGSD